jgi:lactate permease
VTLIVLVGAVRMKAQRAAPIALVAALLVATAVYGMPLDAALLSAAEGAAFGLFPIMWIVVMAMWVFNMTVVGGNFAVLRRSIASVSTDQRLQAVLIAFCFGALMEALAGFGAPAAIAASMLIGLGFKPITAAGLALLGNTAAVAFGALGVPIRTLSDVTEIDEGAVGAMVGRQTPLVALLVPFILVWIVDGRRGIRQTWPVALVGGLGFGIAQNVCSNHVSVALTDIVASISSLAAIVVLLHAWTPAGAPATRRATGDSARDVLRAYAPYLVILAVFSIAQLPSVKNRLSQAPWSASFQWPGLDVRNPAGAALPTATFHVDWLASAGTLMLISGLISVMVMGLAPSRTLRAAGAAVVQLRAAIVVVTSVLALAYVVNQSGQTLTLGLWAAGSGSVFAFLAPMIGWLGVAVTGSDTASNALFGAVQVAAADHTGISATLLAAANASGGVLGKMISAQHVAIAAAAVGIAGHEGVVFRKLVGWGIGLLLVVCVVVYLQSTAVLDWMVVH